MCISESTKCLALFEFNVWLFQHAWKKAFPNNSLGPYRISRTFFFFFGLMHHSEGTYRPDEAARGKLCTMHSHVVLV